MGDWIKKPKSQIFLGKVGFRGSPVLRQFWAVSIIYWMLYRLLSMLSCSLCDFQQESHYYSKFTPRRLSAKKLSPIHTITRCTKAYEIFFSHQRVALFFFPYSQCTSPKLWLPGSRVIRSEKLKKIRGWRSSWIQTLPALYDCPGTSMQQLLRIQGKPSPFSCCHGHYRWLLLLVSNNSFSSIHD